MWPLQAQNTGRKRILCKSLQSISNEILQLDRALEMLQLVYSIMHAACHRCTTLGQNSECNTWRVVSPSVAQKKFCLDKSNFVYDKITFVDRSNFCQDKIAFVRQNQLLSDKINFCLTKSTFVWQNQLLSDKNNFVVDKITFVRQKWLLLDKICFCQQKCACYKRRPIKVTHIRMAKNDIMVRHNSFVT